MVGYSVNDDLGTDTCWLVNLHFSTFGTAFTFLGQASDSYVGPTVMVKAFVVTMIMVYCPLN